MPSGIAVKAVYSIVSYGKAGKPAAGRGSGRFWGAQVGGVMQRNLGVCVLAASRSQVQSTAKRLILRISLGAWRQLVMLMILCLLLACGVAHAQGVNSASLAGTLLDSAHAALKGSEIAAANASTP